MARSKRNRATLKLRLQRREPHYITCLMVHGPRPESYVAAQEWKDAIIQWWMDSIQGDTPPTTNRSGHRFYKRFLAWWHAKGREEVTTVVKEQGHDV